MYYYRGYSKRPRQEKPAHLKDAALKIRIEALRVNPAADDWVQNFCESILAAFDKYGGLTESQYQVFLKNESKCSPAAITARANWAAQYDDDKRAIARICARYYLANPPYFGDLAEKFLNDSTFVPTEKQYRSMCENKYAARVLAANSVQQLYPDGSLVELRVPYRTTLGRLGATFRGMVIEANVEAVTSAAKGSKKYKILPIGLISTVIVEEREIKKAKKFQSKG